MICFCACSLECLPTLWISQDCTGGLDVEAMEESDIIIALETMTIEDPEVLSRLEERMNELLKDTSSTSTSSKGRTRNVSSSKTTRKESPLEKRQAARTKMAAAPSSLDVKTESTKVARAGM